MQDKIRHSLNESQEAIATFLNDDENVARIEEAAQLLISTLKNGNRIFSCGNGGSMSDAMHFAEELTGRFRGNRPALSAVAISDPGHITCVGNDFGFDHIFSRYLEANAQPGDCLLGISTSGSSANVIKAANFARENDMSVISLTGLPNSNLGALATVDLSTVKSRFADRVQEIHIKIIHIFIEMIEYGVLPIED